MYRLTNVIGDKLIKPLVNEIDVFYGPYKMFGIYKRNGKFGFITKTPSFIPNLHDSTQVLHHPAKFRAIKDGKVLILREDGTLE